MASVRPLGDRSNVPVKCVDWPGMLLKPQGSWAQDACQAGGCGGEGSEDKGGIMACMHMCIGR